MKPIVVVPTYDERENVRNLIPLVLATRPDIEVLVVDDASPDGTAEAVEEMARETPRIHILRRPGKYGLGSAYVEGFRRALDLGADLVFQMDADFSHDPKYLPDLFAAIEENDLVIGSRYVSGVNVINWPMSRLILSYSANLYTRLVTGLPIRDCTGGFKCFRRATLEGIHFEEAHSDGYAFQIELSYRAHRKGFRIREIPIVFVDRVEGVSKLSRAIIWEAIWMVWKLRFGSILRSGGR